MGVTFIKQDVGAWLNRVAPEALYKDLQMQYGKPTRGEIFHELLRTLRQHLL